MIYMDCATLAAYVFLSFYMIILFYFFFQFCGSTIAGLSLLSDSIMRLVKKDASSEWLDMLLPRRSLYIMRFHT